MFNLGEPQPRSKRRRARTAQDPVTAMPPLEADGQVHLGAFNFKEPLPLSDALEAAGTPRRPQTATSSRQSAPPTKTTVRTAHRLHGHAFDANVFHVGTAELMGTFFLVLTIVGTVVAAALAQPVAGTAYGSLAVPVAGGVGLAIGISAFGHLSGAHFNPAVTVGLALNGRFPWRWTPVYVLSQLAGSVAAAAVVWAVYGDQARSAAHLAAPSPAVGTDPLQLALAEAVGTFMLVLVIVAVATDERASRGVAALSISSALTAAILLTGPISGAGLNPARSIGPMLVAGTFTNWWTYLISPLVAGAAAVALYDLVLRASSRP
jgi:MIP family channel proteins